MIDENLDRVIYFLDEIEDAMLETYEDSTDYARGGLWVTYQIRLKIRDIKQRKAGEW
jgi:hypothetical protein